MKQETKGSSFNRSRFCEPTIRVGREYYCHAAGGECKVLSISDDDEVSIRYYYKKQTMWGVPYGRRIKAETTTHASELMLQSDYNYACWKGHSGTGRTMKDAIKAANERMDHGH